MAEDPSTEKPNVADAQGAARKAALRTLNVLTMVAVVVLLLLGLSAMYVFPLAIVALMAFDLFAYVGLPLAAIAWLTAVVGWVRAFGWGGLGGTIVKMAIVSVAPMAVIFGVLGLGGAQTHLAGLQVKYSIRADIPAIQAWARTYQPRPDDRSYDPGGASFAVARANWPACIRSLNPVYVNLNTATREVELWYGGGFAHWGLGVPKSRRTPSHTLEADLWRGDGYVFEQE